MRILIVTPHADPFATGNRCTAEQWGGIFGGLGHEVEIATSYEGQACDLLVALHAGRSAESVAAFHGNVVVVLTGTDIYPEPGERELKSMRRADRIVVLQAKAMSQVPVECRDKTRVIVQAAPAFDGEAKPSSRHFDIAVVANLREVKDPLLAARASRLLPASSKARVQHAGAVLEDKFEALAREEMKQNPRYEWLGPLESDEAQQLIADCQLLVVSSLSEGAGRVVGEAIVVGTPVLSTEIDGVIGLLGEDYPGYFPVGDAAACAERIALAESDVEFMRSLQTACDARVSQFAPATEAAAWERLMDEL